MSRRPAVLSLGQLQEAARAAVAAAVAERTVALTTEEARNTSGGALSPSFDPLLEPTTLGMLPPSEPDPFVALQ